MCKAVTAQAEETANNGVAQIRSVADAECLDVEASLDVQDEAGESGERRSKRVRKANRLYQSDTFWCHYNEDSDTDTSDVEQA